MNRITRATARRIEPVIISIILVNLKFSFFIHQNMHKSRQQIGRESYTTLVECYIIHRLLVIIPLNLKGIGIWRNFHSMRMRINFGELSAEIENNCRVIYPCKYKY